MECIFWFLESVYLLIDNGKSMVFSFLDIIVVKVILELVVRWGIYFYLSFGVGIFLEKCFGEKLVVFVVVVLKEYVLGEGFGFFVGFVGV